jgi:hypothetical protein
MQFASHMKRAGAESHDSSEEIMFSYSVKFVCGSQGATAATQVTCSPVRQGIYATEINIHNFQRDKEAVIEKRAIVLVHNGDAVGREPKFVKAQPFDKIALPPDSGTMDDCCRLGEKLQFAAGRLNIGFLEILSSVELNVTAVYTATDLKSASISMDVESVAGRQIG